MNQKSEIRIQKSGRPFLLISGFRFLFSALVAIATSACGFHPLYGEINGKPGARIIFDSVYVPPIELERAGYELRNDLVDALRARIDPQGASYDLKIDLTDRQEPIAIQNETVHGIKEIEITRYNYTLIASYALIDRKTQKPLTRGSATSLSAYDVVASPYATLVAKQDVQVRTAQDLARQIQTRLAVYFARQAGTPP
ncbi:MAG: hypothetical protein JO056_01150 [Alphaproteobacteria bacterium]|nr:hypothetical protein [Alphaproteobacteria bacterium]